MHPPHGFHRRFLSKRRGLGAVLDVLLGSSSTSTSVGQVAANPAGLQSSGDPFDISVIAGGITSLVGGVSATSLLPLEPSSTTTTSTPSTHSSASSTGSTTSSAATISSISSTASTSTTPISSATPPPIQGVPSSISEVVYTSSDGTNVVYITSTMPITSATTTPTTFLRDPSLEGGIFALVGVVVLIILCAIVTWSIRKRRRDRLERDVAAAVTFDPGATDHYARQEDSMEKNRLSISSSGHGHMYGYGYGYGMQSEYAPHQGYQGPVGYGQYSHPVPSDPAPFQAPSPAVPQPTEQGGAKLARKFSDRKPVPPLLPTPTYDPSNTHVSIPPQFYQ